jgi:excinuclease ABC subunit B
LAIQIRTSLAEPETGIDFVPHRPNRPDKIEGGKRFKLVSDYEHSGDPRFAIPELVE